MLVRKIVAERSLVIHDTSVGMIDTSVGMIDSANSDGALLFYDSLANINETQHEKAKYSGK